MITLLLLTITASSHALLTDAHVNALTSIYQGTNGGNDTWTNNSGWDDSASIRNCTAYGLTCNNNNTHLTSLRLGHNGLTGQLPENSLCVLSKLTTIDLCGNNLAGEWPVSISCMEDLKWLNIGHCLEEKVLDEHECNQFHGTIPPEWHLLRNVEFVILGSPCLTSPIRKPMPELFSKWTSLKHLDIGHLGFEGPFPSFLGNCTSLEYLSLGHNNWEGEWPKHHEFDQLTNIRHFDMSFTGTFSPGVFPSFLSFWIELRVLHFHNMGFLGDHLGEEVYNLINLIELNLAGAWFTKFDANRLGSLENLRLLDISHTMTDPWKLTDPWKNMNLTVFKAQNMFAEWPDWVYTQWDIQRISIVDSEFTNTPTISPLIRQWTRLEEFTVNNCNFHGELPEELFNKHLRIIQLENNHFTGTLPPQISEQEHLQLIHINNNQLTGDLRFICGLHKLHVLDASNNQFDQFGLTDCELAFEQLTKLIVNNNHFEYFSFDFSFLFPNLHHLDLSNNQIQSLTGATTTTNNMSLSISKIVLDNNPLRIDLSSFADFFNHLDSLFYLSAKNCSIDGHFDIYHWSSKSLAILDLSNNLIKDSLLNVLTSTSQMWSLASLHLAHNELFGSMHYSPDYHLDIRENTHTHDASSKRHIGTYFYTEDNLITESKYSCHSLVTNKGKQFMVDPHYFDYESCTCSSGTYGNIPDCIDIPSVIHPQNHTKHTIYTDAIYGTDRTTPGIDMIWHIEDSHAKHIRITVELHHDWFADEEVKHSFIVMDSQDHTVKLFSSHDDHLEENTNYTIDVFDSDVIVTFISDSKSGKHISFGFETFTDCPPEGFEHSDGKCYIRGDIIQSVQISMHVITSISVLFIIVLLVFTIVRRHRNVWKASTPILTTIMLMSSSVICTSTILRSLGMQEDTIMCIVRPWMETLPTVIWLSCIFSKTYRISKVFNTDKRLSVVIVHTSKLIRIAAYLSLVECLILSTHTVLKLSTVTMFVIPNTRFAYFECTTPHVAWMAAHSTYLILLLIITFVFAWKTKDVPARFNEAREIVNAIITFVTSFLVFVPILWLTHDDLNATIFITVIGMSLTIVFMNIAMFIPKCYYDIRNIDLSTTVSSHIKNSKKLAAAAAQAQAVLFDCRPFRVPTTIPGHDFYIDKRYTEEV